MTNPRDEDDLDETSPYQSEPDWSENDFEDCGDLMDDRNRKPEFPDD